MSFLGLIFTLITYSCLATLVKCASDPWGSFIFPPNSSVSNFSVEAPTVADLGLTVHFNDSFVIEYDLPDSVQSLWLSQQCYNTINETNTTYGFGAGYQGSAFNQSTGTLLWNLGSGNITDSSLEDTSIAGSSLNYCLFAIYNWTIESCTWGPFGLTSMKFQEDLSAPRRPLIVSELFEISPPNPEGPSLLESTKTTTQNRAPVTALPGNVNCPPSGVPAEPISPYSPIIDSIPPLAEGVEFPEWVYNDYDSEEEE